MRILLTGATGFLGSHLLKCFLDYGYEVSILKRDFSDPWRIREYVSQTQVYGVACSDITKAFQENSYDAVVHTATCYGRSRETLAEIFAANMGWPLTILEKAATANVPIFLNTDTILEAFVNAYSLSKKQFRDWGKFFALHKKIKFINVNLEHMYGPDDDASKFTTYLINSCVANVAEIALTPGEQKRDFIYIDDVTSAYLILLEKAKTFLEQYQEYDVGSGSPVSIRQFAETVHRITQTKTKLRFGAVPYRENETMASQANIHPLQALGWKNVIDLEQGIRLCVKERE